MTAALTVAACGAARPSSTSCGTPYLLTAGGVSHAGGSCAGQIVAFGTISVRRGTSFTIRTVHLKSGKPVFPVPKPGGSEVRFRGLSGPVATYYAARVGRVRLIAHHTTACLVKRQETEAQQRRPRECTAFAIDVQR